MELRRRIPRQVIGWTGKCILEDDPFAGWVECRAIDISLIGVGLEVLDLMPNNLVGRGLQVEVHPPTSKAVSIRMAGKVRNVGPGPTGGTRIGLELTGLSETERSILDTLELMQVAF